MLLDVETVLDAKTELKSDVCGAVVDAAGLADEEDADEELPLCKSELDELVVDDSCVGEEYEVGAVPPLLPDESASPLEEYAPDGVLLALEVDDEYTDEVDKTEEVVESTYEYTSVVLLLLDVEYWRMTELVVEFETVEFPYPTSVCLRCRWPLGPWPTAVPASNPITTACWKNIVGLKPEETRVVVETLVYTSTHTGAERRKRRWAALASVAWLADSRGRFQEDATCKLT